MQTEPEALGVQEICERLERMGVFCQREAIPSGKQAPVGIHLQSGTLAVFGSVGQRFIPLDVHGHYIPTVPLEVPVHEISVSDNIGFPNTSAVTIPGVPTHRGLVS